MESKLFIDINSATRTPQIKILRKHSDDSRDTLVGIFAGQAMPGTNDGFCRIERYPGREQEAEIIMITPVSPVEMVKCIRDIRELMEKNIYTDTPDALETYKKIIESEYKKLFGVIA